MTDTDIVERFKDLSHRDDFLVHMTPSDVRKLIGEIERLRDAITSALELTMSGRRPMPAETYEILLKALNPENSDG